MNESTAPKHLPPIAVAAGLVFRHGRVLVTQRRASDHLGGLWEFPGGKCESGESYPDALRRELREELDIEVEVLDRIQMVDHAYPDRFVHLEFYRCRLIAREPSPLGCAQVAWVLPGDLASYSFPPADARLLDDLRQSPWLWHP